MAKNKVLFLITKATYGGAQRYVYDLAHAAQARNFDVHVAYGVSGRLREMLAGSPVVLHAIPSLARDVTLISDVRSFFEIMSLLKKERPDVLHLNSSKAAGIGAFAARLTGVQRIIFTIHGWPFKENRSPVARGFIYFASWLTSVLSHHVIVVSKSDERIAQCMWWVRKKITHVPIGFEAPTLLSPDEGFRKMFGALPPAQIQSDTLRLVTIAELTKNKGIAFAIDAVSELKNRDVDCVYLVVSDGEEHATLERSARDRGVADRIFLPGFVPDAAQNLAGFDLFVLPSIKEGMPYVLLEADAAGLPIIATDVIDPELAKELRMIRIVQRGDGAALADAIQELAHRPRMEPSGTRFPLHQMLERTFALYRLR
ncbi:glycosyltransferase [Candidatus Kaiserbacteria bacterium]|nr:glycosyltransferase [Candidatus Kaiserbacteria bacterium]